MNTNAVRSSDHESLRCKATLGEIYSVNEVAGYMGEARTFIDTEDRFVLQTRPVT